MSKGTVTQIVTKIITPLLEENEFELVDVEFVKEGPHRYLRVYIDKDGGISLDDCQMVSVFLNAELDRIDPIEENYYLEVSSPGIERLLKKDKDFERFIGKKVQAKLFQTINGQKIIIGELLGLEKNCILIKGDLSGETISIPREKAAQVKLIVEIN